MLPSAQVPSIALSTDGKIEIKNLGTQDVHLKIDVMGYFAGGATEGGGFTVSTQTTLFDSTLTTKLNPGEARTFTAGGAANVPTYGASGVMATVTAFGWNASGGLELYRTGIAGKELNLDSVYFSTADSSSVSATTVVRPGDNGNITIVNHSTGTVHARVFLQGWFKATRRYSNQIDEDAFRADAQDRGYPSDWIEQAVFDPGMIFDTGPQAFSSVPSSSTLTNGVVVASGQLLQNGAQVASEPLLLSVQPASAFSDPPKTTWTDEILISRTISDGNGNWTFKVPTSSQLASAATSDGLVNFVVTDIGSKQLMPFFFTRRLIPTSTGYKLADPDETYSGPAFRSSTTQSSQPAGISSAVPMDAAVVDETSASVAPNFVVSDVLDDNEEPVVDNSVANPPPLRQGGVGTCGLIWDKKLGLPWGTVNQFWSNVSGVEADAIYSTGSTSHFGIGVSATGEYGTFKAGGTISVDSTDSVGFPTATGAVGRATFRTQFRLSRYKRVCTGVKMPPLYVAKTDRWVGGAITRTKASAGVSQFTYCVWYGADSHYTKSATRAMTWENGLSTKALIGIDLSARTGYTSDSMLTVHFSTGRHLCGWKDFPVGGPRALAAKP